MLGNINNLVSLQMGNQLSNMTQTQKQEFAAKVKKQAGYYMLNVYKALQQKNYLNAKNILIYIADSCSCIDNPDRQIQQLIEICCQELAQVQKIEDHKQQHRLNNMTTSRNGNGNGKRKIDLYVMRYNKFSGQFQCDEAHKRQIHPDVMFYMSKINSILFNQQNNESVHSMLAMFRLFWVEILITLVLIFILILMQFGGVAKSIFVNNPILQKMPSLIVISLFLLPIIAIHLKQSEEKDTAFFQIKLGQEIKKINQTCRQKKQKIMFMMPQGLQINVKVEHEETSQVMIDLSRIKKRLTFYQKSQSKS